MAYCDIYAKKEKILATEVISLEKIESKLKIQQSKDYIFTTQILVVIIEAVAADSLYGVPMCSISTILHLLNSNEF